MIDDDPVQVNRRGKKELFKRMTAGLVPPNVEYSDSVYLGQSLSPTENEYGDDDR